MLPRPPNGGRGRPSLCRALQFEASRRWRCSRWGPVGWLKKASVKLPLVLSNRLVRIRPYDCTSTSLWQAGHRNVLVIYEIDRGIKCPIVDTDADFLCKPQASRAICWQRVGRSTLRSVASALGSLSAPILLPVNQTTRQTSARHDSPGRSLLRPAEPGQNLR